ncbi:MAG: flavodoxin-dependent (E)-4-hydroxy-3-methylbut-2-enyl-diphosphate synthase, partial [Methanobacterium paludis]|nr:flavodoxin-dependent (E)-4-hydroxy-3-methylbut-2-enyl-diphosphate synthase [Methanobacterium paludis]
MKRSNTKKIKLGNIFLGGDSKITVQSMTNTDTSDIQSTIRQIKSLEKAGCDIARCAVPDMEACNSLKDIVKNVSIPVVADIHFDYKLAIQSIKNGVAGLRINQGNIGSITRVKEVAKAAKDSGIPIRVGVNSGSLNKNVLKKYGEVSSDALVESALNHVKILENVNFD